ncbi:MULTISPECIES: barstar family protein [Bacillus]|uniref:barstar family protein n=1 Tax=Bacillus TaxID=1386 RepID=UPI0004589040|nr:MULTISPECIES: barstar family protein [Bacillus]AHZ17375.1 Barstar Ribonuclease inhibitor [Bacillus velezensis SQR9]AKF75317.1 barnase inhibitor [Bacillus velezensis]AWD14479.1 barnase inhibitor [Bacillus velezensis]MDH2302738.1 barstar family protein [Bacillus velezensis]MDR4963473.1 barstar family protein [Bacillus velezensis]
MEIAIIDGKDVTSTEALHRILKDQLDFPDFYGENLNALWDCLTGWIEFPLTLVWKNFEASQKALGSDADDVLELFQEAQEELGNRFVIQIDQPSAGTTDRH